MIRECPPDLTPALMLTRDPAAQQGFRRITNHLLFVTNIDEYRRTEGNVALAYLARHLDVDALQIGEFTDLSVLGSPDEVRALLAQHLEVDQVAAWLNENDERKQQVAELVDLSAVQPGGVDRALDALNALGDLTSEQLDRLLQITIRVTHGDNLVELLRSATEREPGRAATSQVLGERLTDRLNDAREVVHGYEALLQDPSTSETDMQRYLTQNPLLFGLQYATIRPQVNVPKGTLDFLLERFDGYHDLLELKGPSDEIIKVTRNKTPGSASPHRYRLGKALAQGLAQAVSYRDQLTRFADAADELYGIKNARDPWLFVVLGRSENMQPDEVVVLQELNKTLHRALVIPYNLLAQRAHAVLDNLAVFLQEPTRDH